MPIALDLCCGLGGWTEGLLAEGWDVIGFDVMRHEYGGESYPVPLILEDVRSLDGRNYRGIIDLIVASPPCQEFSYMAMPWSRGKQIASALRGLGEFPEGYKGSRSVKELTAIFKACVRIGREAECPTVIENVRGAQPWVGRAQANFGSFYLWGDVPALMPKVQKASNGQAQAEVRRRSGMKTPAGNCSAPLWKDRPIARLSHATPEEMARHGFKGTTRNAASAQIAKIPELLARWVARYYHPDTSPDQLMALLEPPR